MDPIQRRPRRQGLRQTLAPRAIPDRGIPNVQAQLPPPASVGWRTAIPAVSCAPRSGSLPLTCGRVMPFAGDLPFSSARLLLQRGRIPRRPARLQHFPADIPRLPERPRSHTLSRGGPRAGAKRPATRVGVECTALFATHAAMNLCNSLSISMYTSIITEARRQCHSHRRATAAVIMLPSISEANKL